MPLPVIVSSPEEKALLHAQPLVAPTIALGQKSDVTFVGIGDIALTAPLLVDGFLKRDEMEDPSQGRRRRRNCGWIFGADGKLLDHPVNDRLPAFTFPRGNARL